MVANSGNWKHVKRRLDPFRIDSFMRRVGSQKESHLEATKLNMPSIAYIIARTENGVIGCNNKLPWTMRTDLKRFRAVTLNHVVVMGRKTYDSIGHALPHRENVVISRDRSFQPCDARVFSTFEDAILFADIYSITENLDKTFVVGGAVVFDKMKDYVSTAYVTEIHTADIEGDAVFDYKFDPREWSVAKKEQFTKSDLDEYDSTFYIYNRRKAVLRQRGIRDFLTHAA
jgi:dihydrofolate reductase